MLAAERVALPRRADRGDRRRDRGGRRSRRSSACSWTSRSCPPSSTSRRRSKPDAPRRHALGHEPLRLRGPSLPAGPLRRRRGGARGRRPRDRGHLPDSRRPSTRRPRPPGCIAKPEADGRITVHTNTQALYFSLDNTAIILQIEPARLHFIGGTVGGGFGGKVDVITEPIAWLAALKTGRPVRYVYTREEEMRVSSTRSGNRIRIVDGVMNDGRIVSREVTTRGTTPAPTRGTRRTARTKHAANVSGPYTIPNVSIDVHCVYTNRQPSSAFRGFGVTEASFAIEMQMDRISRAHRRRSVGRCDCATRTGTATSGRTARSSRTRRWSRRSSGRPAELVGAASWRNDAPVRTRHRRRQLPDRHEPGRRPDPGAGPRHARSATSSSRCRASTSARA